ncbi:MAG TPA: hypothetical protein VGD80_16310 [Kofleriaceae bacterium]
MQRTACLVLASVVALVAVGAAACGETPCDPTAEACTLDAKISTITVPAGHEDEDTCQSWTLNNPTELWVSGITQHNDGAYHHANWFFVPDDEYAVPDGAWSCSQLKFSEVGAALLGGYLFAMSTQSREERQDLPAGNAIRIPPYSRVIGASHLLNAGDSNVTSTMRVSIRTIPPSEVRGKLAPGRITYEDLHLDPQASSSFTTECMIADEYERIMKQPVQYKLVYTLSHYHSLGVYTELSLVGGPHDGEIVMHHDGYGENAGVAIDPPVDLGALGARGLRLTCGFQNPRTAAVGWGIGDQEMCVMALQAITDIGWDGAVGHGDGRKVGVAGDGEVQYKGPCGMLSFVWNFNKAGGPPR